MMKTKDLSSKSKNGANDPSNQKSLSRRQFMLSGGAAATAFAIVPGNLLDAPGQVASGDKIDQKEYPAKADMGWYNVKDFGAKGDGKTLDTLPINKAIETCGAAGGGTVVFPAGVFMTGTLQLKTNITLFLQAGATILGSNDLNDYIDVTNPNAEPKGSTWHAALIVGQNQKNITIMGQGTIDGNNVFNPKGERRMRGPHTVFLTRCEDISIRDIHVKDSANYAYLLLNCSNGNFRGIRVTGGWDGIDLFYSKDFTISDCHFMTGDDCIAFGGCERIVIENSILNSSCHGIINYRGGLKNIILTNLVITGPGAYPHRSHGLRSLEVSGLLSHSSHGDNESLPGISLGNFFADNVVISNISISGMNTAFSIIPSSKSAEMRNIMISNLTATAVGKSGMAAVIQESADIPVESIRLSNITTGPAAVIQGSADIPVESITLSNITIVSQGGVTESMLSQQVRERAGDACYGLYCGNIKDMQLSNIRFSYQEKDARPAMICENVERLELDGVRGPLGTGNESSIKLANIKTLYSRDAEVVSK